MVEGRQQEILEEVLLCSTHVRIVLRPQGQKVQQGPSVLGDLRRQPGTDHFCDFNALSFLINPLLDLQSNIYMSKPSFHS